MKHTAFCKMIAAICIAVMLLLCFSGCGSKSESTADQSAANAATADEADVKPSESELQLSLEEPDISTVALDASIDWESLYYEYLRALNSEAYKSCALIYLNNDDVPELLVKAQSSDAEDLLCFICENGLSVNNSPISDSEGFWYLEKQYKLLLIDIAEDRFTTGGEDESPTEIHNGIRRDATLYHFTGNQLYAAHNLGRYVADGKVYSTGEVDDGGYDYYDGEEDIPVTDVFTAVKGYFDVDNAKTPALVSVGDFLEQLKAQRKTPEIKAGDYSGDPAALVSAYKNISHTIDSTTVSYKIPQIDLDSEEVQTINKEIRDTFADDIDRIENASDDMTRFKSVDYHVYGRNGILSLVIDGKGFGGTSSPDDRMIYTVDITAKKPVSNICLLNSYGVDCLKVSDAFKQQVKADYDAIKNDPEHPVNHPDSGFDASVYDDLYDRTVERFSPVGDYNKMFFDDEDNLNILYLYKWVAGSEFYQKTMILEPDALS